MRPLLYQRIRFVAVGLARHLRRRWGAYAGGMLLFGVCHAHYRIGVNVSNSLQHHLYLIELDIPPTREGELVAFRWQRTGFYRPDRIFVKEVRGLAGAKIAVRNRQVYVNGVYQGLAKPVSKRGIPLSPIAAGIVPCGYLYVHAGHPDSLDSRYAITGLVGPERIVGRAHAIF